MTEMTGFTKRCFHQRDVFTNGDVSHTGTTVPQPGPLYLSRDHCTQPGPFSPSRDLVLLAGTVFS